MDITKMLDELRAERAQVEEAILVLERLAAGRGRRRGRPPAWMSAVNGAGAHRGVRTRRRKGSLFVKRRLLDSSAASF
jgi:hypothetical protein